MVFSLYQVSNGVAADFECDPEKAFDEFDRARVAGTAAKFGRYFAAVFRLKAGKGKSDAITLLWTKEGKYWKVVAWDVEPEEAKTQRHAGHPAEASLDGCGRTEGECPGQILNFCGRRMTSCTPGW